MPEEKNIAPTAQNSTPSNVVSTDTTNDLSGFMPNDSGIVTPAAIPVDPAVASMQKIEVKKTSLVETSSPESSPVSEAPFEKKPEPRSILDEELSYQTPPPVATPTPAPEKKISPETTTPSAPAIPGNEPLPETPLPKIEMRVMPTKEQLRVAPIGAVVKTMPRESHRAAIRTYESDVAETIQNKSFSLADIAFAERKQEGTKTAPEQEQPSRNIFWAVGAGVIVLLAVVVVVGAYILRPQDEIPISVIPREDLPILVDAETTLDATNLDRTRLSAALAAATGEATSPGSVVYIQATLAPESEPPRTLSMEDLLGALRANAPDRLIRALDKTPFIGVHGGNTPAAFMIISVVSFEAAFADMLAWEPYLADDLTFITREVLTQTEPTPHTDTGTSTVSSTPAPGPEKTQPFKPGPFKDIVVKNEDVRAQYGEDGLPIIVYSFADPNTLIIAQTTETLEEVFRRLTQAQFSL